MRLRELQQSGLEPAAALDVEHLNRHPQCLGRGAQLLQRSLEDWVGGVRERADAGEMREQVFQQLQSLAVQVDILRGEGPRHVDRSL